MLAEVAQRIDHIKDAFRHDRGLDPCERPIVADNSQAMGAVAGKGFLTCRLDPGPDI